MSLQALVSVWDIPDLTPTEKLVALCIADFADQDGKCWPSQGLIARRCGSSRETVNRALKSLSAKGVITLTNRLNERGKQSNVYVFSYVTKDHTPCDNPSLPCDTGSQPHVTQDHIEPPNLEPTNYSNPPISPQGDESRSLKKMNGVKAYFADFWQRYPKKVGKADAERSFVRAAKKSPVPEILAGLTDAALHWQRENTDQRFIPNPATWLNQGRWQDEYVEPRAEYGGSRAPPKFRSRLTDAITETLEFYNANETENR